MKNSKIFALLVSSIIASHSYGRIEDVILKAIPPVTGAVIGSFHKGGNAERILAGMVVSVPGAIVYGREMAEKEETTKSFMARIPYCGAFIGEMITYGVGIGAGVLARAIKTKIVG